MIDTFVVMSRKAEQAANFFPLRTKASEGSELRMTSCFLTPLAGLTRNLWPSGQPISDSLRGAGYGN